MATVSILIPASKADYLGRALISAQRQTYSDIEILVGDDTPDGSLARVVEGLEDTRVRYFHHGLRDARRNAQALWDKARGKYVKWLADSDMLMPTSVEVLVDALRQNPESALAFHARVLVDENDAVVETPPLIASVGERMLIDRALLVGEMVGQLHNFVGEPSNIMIDRERASASDLFSYRSLELDYLGDVATYLNLAERGPLIVVGGYWSMLRRQAAMASAAESPAYSAGLYEWELFVRGEAAAGRLTGTALAEAASRLRQHYGRFAAELPEIGRLLANLDELTARAPQDLFNSPRFQSDLAHARAVVAGRLGRGAANGAHPAQAAVQPPAASAPVSVPVARPLDAFVAAAAPSIAAPKVCAVCEQPVDRWLPHPHKFDRTFLEHVAPVGSTLERHLCPRCGCHDRERHLWLYIAMTGLLERASEMRILHIAPEARIEPRIRRLGPREYILGDLFPSGPGHVKINAESLQFADDQFDLIICNHVLEHVDNPRAALAEFHRCLKPGGHLIAQTPYSPLLKYTFELTTKPTPEFATRYFGQSDHVRFFGADIAEHFHAAGFSGELLPHASVLPELDENDWGVNGREPFFLFAKTQARPAARPAGGAAAHARPATRSNVPIRLVCATRVAQENFLRDTALGRSLAVHRLPSPPELLLFDKNSKGLPTLYNAAIEQAASSPAILVFVHDDVSINDHFWMDRVREALDRFDVVGLAGNTRRSPLQPGWAFATPDFKWDSPEFLSGSVGHGKGFPCDEVSHFGRPGVECKLLDGLMLIADSARLIESGLRFDEQFAFHFYDMDFCRQAELKGVTMGTWPISVVHESAGAFNTPPWRAAYEQYLRKYGE